MMIYSFGDTLLIPFPFTDQTQNKKRPTVVISSDEHNRIRPAYYCDGYFWPVRLSA